MSSPKHRKPLPFQIIPRGACHLIGTIQKIFAQQAFFEDTFKHLHSTYDNVEALRPLPTNTTTLATLEELEQQAIKYIVCIEKQLSAFKDLLDSFDIDSLIMAAKQHKVVLALGDSASTDQEIENEIRGVLESAKNWFEKNKEEFDPEKQKKNLEEYTKERRALRPWTT